MQGGIGSALVLRLPELVPLSSAAPRWWEHMYNKFSTPTWQKKTIQIAYGVTHVPQNDIWCSPS